ncbi:MAG TPA: N-acetylmuramoyl-L-alanine amidase [Phycisphaerae bacterium]|jgi:N-acetylmuramoyl-L-alanine amidase
MPNFRATALLLAVTMVALGACRIPKRPNPTPPVPQAAPNDDPMVSTNTLLAAAPDFALQRIGTPEFPVPPYAKFLKGVRIRLDPGHGGDADKRAFKRGPTGVREAEINLRVAQYLRDLLVAAGAEVQLSRESDVDLSYEERAGANLPPQRWADLFISCHHNAIDNKPSANHTTVWYHADVDYHPSNLDLARYLCYGLYDHYPLEQITDEPLKSDQLMYPEGFAVLRHAKVTAALVETSFYTNPEEEQRLRRPESNLGEAYGLFIGLAKYAANGLPRLKLISPRDGLLASSANGDVLEFILDDGLRGRKSWGSERQMILTSSLNVRWDDQPLAFEFANDGYRLSARLPDHVSPGAHRVSVQFQNLFKNSVINPTVDIRVEEGSAAAESR